MKTLLICLFSLCLMSGCVKQPTQSEKTVDLRPAISFSVKNETQIASDYTVYVDKLEMGNAGEYLENDAALRLLPGSHLIELKYQGTTVYSTKVYLGDGAIKTFPIP